MARRTAVTGRILPIRSEHFYDDQKITPLLGQRAGGLDVANRQVLLADDTHIDFGRLL